MITDSRILSIIIAACLIVFLFSPNAHAYLDPGTGSYILQIFIAAVVGGLFAVKVYWRKLKAFFLSKIGKQNDEKIDDV